ncbi:hypothetical protein LR48_Vigan10g210200 [Vigna angularis]|uniref:Uncharacterized protein n=1 Tax=Phaseolus angularis TaxID=3914 RepID=A0A0L9VMD0_PHAAN|nr:hypothetical protein LR48_Vigan10g210200 [Vigna angularis]
MRLWRNRHKFGAKTDCTLEGFLWLMGFTRFRSTMKGAMLDGNVKVNLCMRVVCVLDENDVLLALCSIGAWWLMVNSLKLLKEIKRYGGDITLPSINSGTTALHVVVSEGNVEIVKYLLDHGASIDKPDKHGWTAKGLADQQSHTEIKAIFYFTRDPKVQSFVTIPEKQSGFRFLGRFTSKATMPSPLDGSFHGTGASWSQSQNRLRHRSNNYHYSLLVMMAATHNGEKDLFLPLRD